jgi:hypothetical protein
MARAKLPKPPRDVSPEPETLDPPEDEAESPPNKLVRRDHPLPEPLWVPLEPEVQVVAAVGDDGETIAGPAGWQFSRGISA